MRSASRADPGAMLLEVRDLRVDGLVGETWHPIVKGVDLTLRRGEVLGLIGESGAGKSTVGLAVMGFAKGGCRISGGTVRFDGIDLAQASERELRALRGARIAYVSQSAAASFNPAHRLIRQYCEGPVRHGLRSTAEAAADGVELYRRMRLPEPESIGLRYPHQVSGGQLQRAITAMAMSCRPDLIIFDEPTTALDVTTQVEVLGAIRDVVDQFGTAAIYITHDLAVVAQMADRIKVLRYGAEVEEAETARMLSDPREDYTKSLWAVRKFRATAKPKSLDTVRPAIEVEGVTASYGRLDVLHDVSFSVARGHTVAVVGESGSGKSSLARVIAGLLPPGKGVVRFNGAALPADFRKRPRDLLRRIQLIYQMPDVALNPRHDLRETVGRPLAFYQGLRGRRLEERTRELLDMVELEPGRYIDRLPRDLSGGQKQRVCIARALAAEPDFIVCDEVTSALDQIVAEGVLKLLDRLQNEFDLSLMFITHDLATVRAIADEVVVMMRGHVVETADKSSLFADPKHPYTRHLLASIPEMDPGWLDRTLAERQGGKPPRFLP